MANTTFIDAMDRKLNTVICRIMEALEENDENLFSEQIKVLKKEKFINGVRLCDDPDNNYLYYICGYYPWNQTINIKVGGVYDESISINIDDENGFKKLRTLLKKYDII